MRVRSFAIRASIALMLLLATAASATAQQDAEGSNDHPMLSRFPGYYIEDHEAQDFGVHEFQLADDKLQKVEGRYWQISYWLKEGAKKSGPVQIGRNYSSLLVKQGGKTLYEDLDAGGGLLTARMPASGKNIWLEVDISNDGEVYTLTVVEEAGMEQKVEFSAAELSKMLSERGSVALRGILFDTQGHHQGGIEGHSAVDRRRAERRPVDAARNPGAYGQRRRVGN
jgi:OmpA-OmpF porin, OOP family